MRWLRYFPSLFLVAPLCLLGLATGQPPGGSVAKPDAKPPAANPAKADAEATKLLDAAIQALDPKRLDLVETTLWQQVDSQGLTFQAEGTYLSAPNHHLRLDLQVRLGDALGKLLVVSDGVTLWERLQVGPGGQADVRKIDLKSLLNRDLFPEQVQTEFIPLAGVVPLLQSVRRQMTVTGREALTWRGRQVVKLTAAWSGDVTKAIVPAGSPWPQVLPQRCTLYLDADPKALHWPHRIEWWGPAGQAGEALLLQMEFRNPKLVLEKGLTDEQKRQYADKFQFNPGKDTVHDLTKQTLEQAKNRSKQLASRQAKP